MQNLPLTHFGIKPRFIKTLVLFLLMGVIGFVGYNSSVRGGLVFRFPDYNFNQPVYEQYAEIVHGYGRIADFIEGCDFINHMNQQGESYRLITPKIASICYETNPLITHKVLIWGDSFAQMLSYGLIVNLPRSWQLLQVSSRGCQASIFANSPSTDDYCQQSNYFALKTIASAKPDVVVISQNSTLNQQNINAISSKLHEIGVRKIVYVDKPPRWIAPLPKLLFRKKVDASQQRNYLKLDVQTQKQINGYPKFKLDGEDLYLNTTQYFCTNDGCLLFVGDESSLAITTLDDEHLTPAASNYFARTILVRSITD